MEYPALVGPVASVVVLVAVSGVFLSLFLLYNVLALVGRRPRSAEQVARGGTVYLPVYVREFWDWVVGPVVRLLVRRGVNPDAITFTSVVLAAGAAVAFAFGHFGLGGWLYILGGTCDMLDGKVARATRRSSRAGAFIDSTLDRYTEIFVLVGLAWYFRGSPVLLAALLALGGSLMVSYARARGEGLGHSCREGGMQRAERVVYLGVGAVLGRVFEAWYPGSDASRLLVSAALVLIAVSSNVTAVQRMVLIVRALRRAEAEPSAAEEHARESPPPARAMGGAKSP